MEEKCPCQIYVKSCCACVSMHCDECHGHSKFVQGRFCSNCGRPLKGDVDWHREAELNAQRIMVLEAELSRYTENCKHMVEQAKTEIAREIFEEIENAYKDCMINSDGKWYMQKTKLERKFAELKKKYTEE